MMSLRLESDHCVHLPLPRTWYHLWSRSKSIKVQAHVHALAHLPPPERLRRSQARIDVQPKAGIVQDLREQMKFLRLVSKRVIFDDDLLNVSQHIFTIHEDIQLRSLQVQLQ